MSYLYNVLISIDALPVNHGPGLVAVSCGGVDGEGQDLARHTWVLNITDEIGGWLPPLQLTHN